MALRGAARWSSPRSRCRGASKSAFLFSQFVLYAWRVFVAVLALRARSLYRMGPARGTVYLTVPVAACRQRDTRLHSALRRLFFNSLVS